MTTREIDTLIAKHLFGWKQVATTRGQTFHVPADYPPGPYDEDAIKYQLTPERYSTSGNGLMLVLEAMEVDGWLWQVIPQRDYLSKVIYRIVAFMRGSEERIARLDASPDLPHATALAALRALGVDVEAQP